MLNKSFLLYAFLLSIPSIALGELNSQLASSLHNPSMRYLQVDQVDRCPDDVLVCWDQSKVSRNPLNGCNFYDCPPQTNHLMEKNENIQEQSDSLSMSQIPLDLNVANGQPSNEQNQPAPSNAIANNSVSTTIDGNPVNTTIVNNPVNTTTAINPASTTTANATIVLSQDNDKVLSETHVVLNETNPSLVQKNESLNQKDSKEDIKILEVVDGSHENITVIENNTVVLTDKVAGPGHVKPLDHESSLHSSEIKTDKDPLPKLAPLDNSSSVSSTIQVPTVPQNSSSSTSLDLTNVTTIEKHGPSIGVFSQLEDINADQHVKAIIEHSFKNWKSECINLLLLGIRGGMQWISEREMEYQLILSVDCKDNNISSIPTVGDFYVKAYYITPEEIHILVCQHSEENWLTSDGMTSTCESPSQRLTFSRSQLNFAQATADKGNTYVSSKISNSGRIVVVIFAVATVSVILVAALVVTMSKRRLVFEEDSSILTTDAEAEAHSEQNEGKDEEANIPASKILPIDNNGETSSLMDATQTDNLEEGSFMNSPAVKHIA